MEDGDGSKEEGGRGKARGLRREPSLSQDGRWDKSLISVLIESQSPRCLFEAVMFLRGEERRETEERGARNAPEEWENEWMNGMKKEEREIARNAKNEESRKRGRKEEDVMDEVESQEEEEGRR